MTPVLSRAAILAAFLAAASVAAAPRIACEDAVYDFGRLAAESPETSHTFTLRNDGDDPLELGEIVSGCGCAVARLENRILMPGATTSLEIRLNLRGRAGRLEKEVTVRSNDPLTPVLRLFIRGDIESTFDLSPTAAMFGAIPPATAATQAIDIVFHGDAGARVTNVTADAAWLTASAAEIEPGRRWRLTVCAQPPYPAGANYLSARVYAATTHPRAPAIVVAAIAMLVREAVVSPAEFVLIEGERGPVTRYALIRPGSAGRLRIVAVEAPDPAIRFEVRTLDDGSLQVALRGIPVSPELDGKPVVLRTDPPAAGPHVIPFRFVPKAQ